MVYASLLQKTQHNQLRMSARSYSTHPSTLSPSGNPGMVPTTCKRMAVRQGIPGVYARVARLFNSCMCYIVKF